MVFLGWDFYRMHKTQGKHGGYEARSVLHLSTLRAPVVVPSCSIPFQNTNEIAPFVTMGAQYVSVGIHGHPSRANGFDGTNDGISTNQGWYFMTTPKITDFTLKAAVARVTIGDGLYLHVSDAGGKLWRYNYRFHGKQKTIAYGKYPDVGLAEAKKRHQAARELLAQQPPVDPMAEKKNTKRVAQRNHDNSFKSVAEAYIKWWSPGKNEGHVARTIEGLQKDVYPAIGHMPITTVEAADIIAIGKAIETRGAEETARRLMGKIGQIFSYAVGNALTKRNPAKDFDRHAVLQPMTPVNFARVDIEEIGPLLRAIEMHPGKPVVRHAMKLLPLVFTRPGKEFLGWRWDEIDWNERTWTIPASRMKKKREHMVPLSTQAIALLKQLHTLTGGGPLLFPSQKPGAKNPRLSDNTFNVALKRMGYKGEQTGHGFRGLASTILNEKWKTDNPHKIDLIELQLAHVEKNKVRGAYNKAEHLEARAVMVQWYADYLERMTNGEPSNVVPFRVVQAA